MEPMVNAGERSLRAVPSSRCAPCPEQASGTPYAYSVRYTPRTTKLYCHPDAESASGSFGEIGTIQTVHETLVTTEHPALDEAETEAFVESVRARVALDRIDYHGRDVVRCEAPIERETHHGRPMPLPQIGRLANPDVDGT
jgi:hypothetical protein